MKRRLRILLFPQLFVLSLLMCANSSYASHSMGADLTYTCLGGNNYKITLTFYRDCIGIAAPASPFVSITSASCAQSFGITCYPRTGTGQEVTPACSSSVTTCNGGVFTGIQEWVYDGIVALPMQCTDWTFSFSLCCRNAAITTITSPGSSTFYIYATLNNTISPCNNSPTFSNKPVPFVCVGQQYCFNHGANDIDGDSLSYQLITPYQTSSTTVNYIAPNTATNPLNSIPATTFNPGTGDICITPQTIEVTVMAVLVTEYRNGVAIGSVERDIQITVMSCANNLPQLSGINGTNNFSMTACANTPFCFDIFSNDPDFGQNLTVTWDWGIAGATFTSTTAQHPLSTFCWTPTTADIGTSHMFTVRVADDACPYFGSQIYSYTIWVTGFTVNAGPDQQTSCNGNATLTATGNGGSGTYTYLWSNGDTTQSITVGAGLYSVILNDGNCPAYDTVLVTMTGVPVASFANTLSLCSNAPVQFTDNSTTTGGIINSWNWNFGDGATSTSQNPSHQYATAGTFTATLIVGTTLGCADTVIQQLIISLPPVATFNAMNNCAGQSICFTDQSTPAGTINTWNWNFGDGGTSISQNPCHTYSLGGIFSVTLIARDTSLCADSVTNIITVYPLPSVSIIAADACVASVVPIAVTIPVTDTIATYNWDFGNGAVSSLQTPNYIYTIAGTYTITLIVTTNNGCTDTATASVTINALPVANAEDQTICFGNSATLTATGGTTYLWSSGQTTSAITVSPAVTTAYFVTVTNASGCSATDIANVIVNALPVANAGADTNICNGDTATLTASGGATYNWIPTGDITSSIIVFPTSNQTYIVQVSDANGCVDDDTVNVIVHAPPVVNLSPVFVCAGATTTLNAGISGMTYAWSTYETTQTISITTSGTYSLTVTNSFGCSATSSCNVTVGAVMNLNLGNISFCNGDSAVLNPGYPGMTYLWTPTGATTQTITVYTAGTYGVTITDSLGCSGTVSSTVNVNPLPVANFTATNVCVGNTTSFTNNSTVSSGTITGWNWNFGDGNVSMQQNPTHTYLLSGIYNVSLVVTSSSGCVMTITNTVTVNPLPVANFSAVNSCLNTAIAFTDLSTVSTGNIISYNWNFGDGNTSALNNPTHSYLSTGTFNATLLVTTAGGCTNTVSKPVTVYPLPVAAYVNTTVCVGNATTFTNASSLSSGTITNYSWNFGDTRTSSLQSPTNTYASAGTYTVSLIVTSSSGCTATVTHTVTVFALPIANAGVDQSICTGTSATLFASGGTSFAWIPGGATTSSITVSPLANTTYTVTITNANGCVSTDAVNVLVNNLPLANAGVNQSICVGNTASLTATGGTTYAWTPGGYTTATISVSPASSTNYIVTATNASGCLNRDTVLVTVNTLPQIVAGPDRNICYGSTVSLSASGGTSYTWYPGGATTSQILVTPLSTINYSVVSLDANGCSSSDTVNVQVNPVPVISIAPAFVCVGFSTTLDAGNTGSTFAWSTGATSQTISVIDSGSYSVVVTSPNGCSTMGSVNVNLGGTLVTNPVTTSVCSGQSTTLNAGNVGCTYLWSTGATTQTISVSTAGSYSVAITNTNGCTATFISNVSINPLPVAAYITAPNCFGMTTSFTNQSTISSGSIASSIWTFGDGYSASSSNTSHIYSSAGSFNTALTVTSAAGCSAITGIVATVYPVPNANFSTTPVCENVSSSFIDQSTIAGGTITSWFWNFGDGYTSAAQNNTHFYPASGIFNASLIVTSNNGCIDTMQHTATVNTAPVSLFTINNNCEGSSLVITNNSSTSSGTITNYEWNFGNGDTSSASVPAYSFATSGNHTVGLIVTSSLGCSDTSYYTTNVHPLPVVDFSTSAGCQNATIPFINHSSVSSGIVSTVYWSFGDGSYSNQFNPNHSFTSSGSFNILLVITTDAGCIDTLPMPLTIFPLPVANFTPQNACEGATVSFANSTTISSGSITQWMWNFADGGSSTLNNPSYAYSSAGTFNVSLTAVSDHGCVNMVTNNLNIFPNPVAEFTATSVCFSSQTQFFNQSSIAGGSTFTSNWSFDNGDTSSLSNPIYTYAVAGNHTVSLTVISSSGCVDSTTDATQVYKNPTAIFSTPNNCFGISTTYDDQSTPNDGTIAAWRWTFGDGTQSISNHPQHTYAQSGSYNVSLLTTTSFGCLDTTFGNVDVYPPPAPVIQTNNVCFGDTVRFADVSPADTIANLTYLWNLGDSTTSPDSSASHLYLTDGNYNLTVNVTTTYGCTANAMALVAVHPMPQAAIAGDSVCFNTPTHFTNGTTISSGTITTYLWDFGDGNTSTTQNANHIYPSAGNYTAAMIAVSNFGCISDTTIPLYVKANPLVHFGSASQGCNPVTTNFRDASYNSTVSIDGWLWDFGDGNVSTSQNPNYTYTQAGSYEVTLTVVTSEGCQSTLTQPGFVNVYPAPLADFTPSVTSVDVLQPLVHFTNESQGYNAYTWNFGDGTIITDIVSPSHVYADTGTYSALLIISNAYGCRDTITKRIEVTPHSTLFIENCFTPNGDGTNDVFRPAFTQMENVQVWIFDRWGLLLKEWNSLDGFWDATYEGRPVQNDVYVYKIKALGVEGKHSEWIGHVSVVR